MTRSAHPPRLETLAYATWALAWLVALGGLALDAWVTRPIPTGLPLIGGTADRARPLCVVVLDGLTEGALWDAPSALPWLRAYAAGGAGGVALAGDPTLTAACVRTLLTGRRPDLLIALHNFDAPPIEGSWLQGLRALGARAAHGGDAGIAQMCAPWLDAADVLAFRDQGPVDQGQCDALAVPFVLERARRGYEVLTLHLTGPDHAGHKHGAAGEAYRAACARADAQTREVVEAFLAQHPDGTVLVAADHGLSLAGTHGGGEAAALRAPFVLRGPGVAVGAGLEVRQAALAPTLAVLLGLPQPPLADAPLDARLLVVPALEAQRALDAYLQARIWMARSAGAAADVEPLEVRRRQAALAHLGAESERELRRLSGELDLLLEPRSLGLCWAASVLALLGLLALALGASPRPAAPRRPALWLAAGGAVLLAGLGLLPRLPLTSVVVGTLAGVGCLVALRQTPRVLYGGAALLLAVLLGIPVVTGSGLALQAAAGHLTNPGGVVVAPALGLALAMMLSVTGLGRGRIRAWLARTARAAPAALVALAGAGLGFLLAQRPFLDPWIPLNAVVALLAWIALLLALRSARSVGAPPGGTRALLALFAALLLTPFVARGFHDPAGWTQAPPWKVAPWALAGLGLSLAAFAGVKRPWAGRADRAHVLCGLGALLLAFGGRWLEVPGDGVARAARLGLAFGPQALALAALALAWRAQGTPDGRFAARLAAALALTRRLTASDAEVALVALLALACVVGARLALPASRRGLAALAVLLLLVRTAAFHAAGGSETWGTVDVSRGFLGLEEFVTPSAAAAGEAGLTWQVVLATAQVSLRFAVPWVLLLAAAGRAGGEGPRGRTLLADLVLGLAARGAALALGLWGLASNAWWVEKAKDVYTLGGGDLVLLLVASALAGCWRRDAVEPAHVPGRARAPALVGAVA